MFSGQPDELPWLCQAPTLPFYQGAVNRLSIAGGSESEWDPVAWITQVIRSIPMPHRETETPQRIGSRQRGCPPLAIRIVPIGQESSSFALAAKTCLAGARGGAGS